MTAKKGQKKRFWLDEEKRSICSQTLEPGVADAQVARRYSKNSNLIFTSLREPHYAPGPKKESRGPEDREAFLPVEVSGPTIEDRTDAARAERAGLNNGTVVANRIDLKLSDGRRIVVEGPTAVSAVVGLVQGLMACSLSGGPRCS